MEPSIQPPLESTSSSSPRQKIKTIDSMKTFLMATAALGPFALPLLWRNPRYKWPTKVAASIAVLAFTWLLLHFAETYLKDQLEQFEQLKAQLEQARQAQ